MVFASAALFSSISKQRIILLNGTHERTMKSSRTHIFSIGLVLGMLTASVPAQTDGTATLNAVIHDYPGNGDDHYTVVWVTTASNQFIRTLWKQGPGFSSGRWNEHFSTWNSARAGDTTVDGYSGSTARNYTSSANNPINPVWNCRDKDGDPVPDGNYKFWVQYVEEDDGQGTPHHPPVDQGARGVFGR